MSDAAGNDDYDATVFRRPLRPAAAAAARSALESYVVLQVARAACPPSPRAPRTHMFRAEMLDLVEMFCGIIAS